VSFTGEEKRLISPISQGDRKAGDPADPRGSHQQRDVAMISARAPQPPLDRADPLVEIVDQLDARLDMSKPRLGEIKAGQQLAAGDLERSAIGT
jgi:hypothetical protein